MKKRRIVAALLTLTMGISINGGMLFASSANMSNDTLASTSPANIDVVPMVVCYTDTEFRSSKEQSAAVAKECVDILVAKEKEETILPVTYQDEAGHIVKTFYDFEDENYEISYESKLTDDQYRYKATVACTWAVPNQEVYELVEETRVLEESIDGEIANAYSMETESECLAALNEFALKKAKKALETKKESTPADSWDAIYSEKEDGIIVKTYWDYPMTLLFEQIPTYIYNDESFQHKGWKASGYIRAANKYSERYEKVNSYSLEPVTATAEGKLPFSIGGDYHDEEHGLDYIVSYDNDILDIKVYNKEADTTNCSGYIVFPGIGIASGSSGLVSVQVNPDYMNSLTIFPSYDNSSGTDATEFESMYRLMYLQAKNPFCPTMKAADELFHVQIKHYDKTSVVFGTKRFSVVDTGNEDNRYEIITEEVNHEWAKPKPLGGTLSDFTYPIDVKKSFDGTVAIDGKPIQTTNEIRVLRGGFLNKIIVTTKFQEEALNLNSADFDYGKIIYATGNSGFISNDDTNCRFRLAQLDSSIPITKDDEAEANIGSSSFGSHTLVQSTIPYNQNPAYSGYELEKVPYYYGYALQYTGDSVKRDDSVSFVLTPAFPLNKQFDDCYVVIAGKAYHLYADMNSNEPVIIEDVDDMPSDKSRFYGSAADELKPLIDASKPDFSQRQTEETVAIITSEPQKVRHLGDVDGNGSVDSMDLIAINKFVLGTASIEKEDRVYADIDKDNTISSADALWLLKYIVGIITEEEFVNQ